MRIGELIIDLEFARWILGYRFAVDLRDFRLLAEMDIYTLAPRHRHALQLNARNHSITVEQHVWELMHWLLGHSRRTARRTAA